MATSKTKKKPAAKKSQTRAKSGAKKTAAKRKNPSTAMVRRSNTAPVKKKTIKKKTFSFFRNPVSGDVGEGLKFGGAGIAISFGLKFTRPIVNGVVGSGPLINSGVTLGTAYALAFGADLLSFTRPYSRYLKITGWTLFWTQLATTYLLPAISGFGGGQAPAPQQGMGWPRRRQMNGIGVWPGVPSGNQGALPAARTIAGTPAAVPATMNGIGVWPGVPSGPR